MRPPRASLSFVRGPPVSHYVREGGRPGVGCTVFSPLWEPSDLVVSYAWAPLLDQFLKYSPDRSDSCSVSIVPIGLTPLVLRRHSPERSGSCLPQGGVFSLAIVLAHRFTLGALVKLTAKPEGARGLKTAQPTPSLPPSRGFSRDPGGRRTSDSEGRGGRAPLWR